MCRRLCAALGWVLLGSSSVTMSGCGDSNVVSPFARPVKDAAPAADDAGSDSPSLIEDEDLGSKAPERDPTIGPPCVDDGQCDDDIDCTSDACHKDGHCRFTPKSARCADSKFCNGEEICEPGLGCIAGEPVSCDDKNPCTIDRCVESTGECEREPRDADGDGDPDGNCKKSGDCDDQNPAVSTMSREVCGNQRDDNCDGEVDEEDCLPPDFDLCEEPLAIEGSGTYLASTEAAQEDYGSSCSDTGARDLALLLEVKDEVVDIEVTAIGNGAIALSAFEVCGRAETETHCEQGLASGASGRVARLRLRGLGPGNHSLLLFTAKPQQIELRVRYLAPTEPHSNETCGTAERLPVGENFVVDLVGAERDLASACEAHAGDRVYFFELDTARDVRLFATSLDGYGEPALSLRSDNCERAEDEIQCTNQSAAQLFARALAAGRYTISVAASAATQLGVTLVTEEASEAPLGETCGDPAPLTQGQTRSLELGAFTDRVQTCQPGGREAVFSLDLEQPSDVLLVQRLSEGDRGAVTMASAGCEEQLSCSSDQLSPVRSVNRGLSAGSYAVIAESELGSPVHFTAFTRSAEPPTLVAFSDSCEAFQSIPETGGHFVGNTTSSTADFSAGCDLGGIGANGSPDQLLGLTLTERRRVLFEMSGSGFDTLLNLRQGSTCPGAEVPGACVAGLSSGRSFLDIVLDPGQYFVQIDGFAGAEGQWTLDVFMADPG